jgi:uncharacterized protein YndB with AHSA1/START domain
MTMPRIVETIETNAPLPLVFRALTTPSELLRWWGDPEICSSVEWEMEPKPGGSWRSRWKWSSTGGEFEIKGEIIEIESPRVLEYTWHDDRYRDLPQTIVRYELAGIPDGTRVTVTHTGFTGDTADFHDYSGGWGGVLAALRADTEALTAQFQGGVSARHRT